MEGDGLTNVRPIEISCHNYSANVGLVQVTVRGMTIRNTGMDAARLEGPSNILVENCVVNNPGERGFSFNGGDRKTLTRASKLCNNSLTKSNDFFRRPRGPQQRREKFQSLVQDLQTGLQRRWRGHHDRTQRNVQRPSHCLVVEWQLPHDAVQHCARCKYDTFLVTLLLTISPGVPRDW